MAQVQYTCVFADPKLYDGGTPSNYGHQWQFNKETCTYNTGMYAPTTSVASSTDITFYGSFTAGELVTSFLMFFLIVIELGKIIAQGLSNFNTKKTFIRYRDADTEITHDNV
jgi:hypothetical protein